MSQFIFKLPDVGEGIAEAELVTWHAKLGDMIEEDQPLADVMTDKATVEITAPVSGRIIERNGDVGAMLAIGAVLFVFETSEVGNKPPPDAARAGEDIMLPAREPVQKQKPAPHQPPARLPVPAFAPAAERPAGLRPLASPAVRQRADEAGVKLQFVSGSGPAGRISQADLEGFLSNGSPAAPVATRDRRRDGVELIKVVGLRRRIADRMSDAKRRIPHFSYIEEVDMTALEALRQSLNDRHGKTRPKLTMLPFLIRAISQIVPNFPQINAHFDDEGGIVHRHAAVHVGIATQTPNGLMVPVLRHAEALDLWETAAEIARLAEAARTGKAGRDELSGSTLTITSLGTLGGVATTPIINLPEVAILGPNKIIERPMVLNGQIAIRKMMNLSSSFDHRVVDGADAAAFIQWIKAALEQPATLFLD